MNHMDQLRKSVKKNCIAKCYIAYNIIYVKFKTYKAILYK